MTADTMQTQEGGSLRPYRSGLVFGFFNAINWQVALGTPMVLLAEALGASPFQVGMAYAFVYILTPVQVLATPLLHRFGFRQLMSAGWGLRSLFLLPAIFVAVLARISGPEPWMVNVLIGSVFLFTFMRSIASCAWVPWLYAILPPGIRGRYFASDQVISGIGSIGILVTCSVLFMTLPLFDAFIVMYSISFAGAVASFFFLRRMPDGEKPSTISLRRVFQETPAFLLKPSPFRRFLAASAGFAILTTPVAPFCAYYLRVQDALAPGNILLFTTMQYAGVVLGSLMLRNQIDRIGPRPFFFLALILNVTVCAYWIGELQFGVTDTAWLPFIYLLFGMGAATWVSATLSFLPHVTGGPSRPLLLSLHGAVTSLIGGLSPIVWGYFLKEPGDVPAMDPVMFQVFFVVGIVGLVAIAFWLRTMEIPATTGERVELGSVVMRPQRAFTYLINLVDVSFAPRSGKPEDRKD
ncbi:MAG TPA: MFS transporter [Opitutaceae bacterium]|nr:MFS transporter [Opitutaceae bacterium]